MRVPQIMFEQKFYLPFISMMGGDGKVNGSCLPREDPGTGVDCLDVGVLDIGDIEFDASLFDLGSGSSSSSNINIRK